MATSTTQPHGHNLDIRTYSLDDLFKLFDISIPENITVEEIKRAKKKVLMTHPDKSGLGAEYFLFYKKAFDIVVKFWENQNKQNREITEENTKYEPAVPLKETTTSVDKSVKKAIQELTPRDFQHRFNKLFEDNMYEKPDAEKNRWFSNEDPIYVVKDSVNNKNMGSVMETLKETQNGLVKYKGVENMISASNVANLYDDQDTGDRYLASDVFSKLKFDDLRKVHKDQTIFAVSERDFAKVPQYTSVDHYTKERGGDIKPMAKVEAERMMSLQEQQIRETVMRKEFAADMKMKENAVKNQSVLANFLQLK